MLDNLSDVQYLQLEVTSFCNAKCPQCSRTAFEGGLSDFVTELHWSQTVLDNLEVGKLTNLKLVVIEGDNGDCMMHPNIEKSSKPFTTRLQLL